MANKLVQFQDGSDNIYPQEVPYSTDEVRVGTWINGKPIYRKVYTGLSLLVTESWLNMASAGDIDNIISATAKGSSTKWNINVSLSASAGYISLASWRNGSTIAVDTVILEYTKATD